MGFLSEIFGEHAGIAFGRISGLLQLGIEVAVTFQVRLGAAVALVDLRKFFVVLGNFCVKSLMFVSISRVFSLGLCESLLLAGVLVKRLHVIVVKDELLHGFGPVEVLLGLFADEGTQAKLELRPLAT